jgi:hypothetical protein
MIKSRRIRGTGASSVQSGDENSIHFWWKARRDLGIHRRVWEDTIKLKMTALWDIAPCSVVEVIPHFRTENGLHNQPNHDGGSMHFRNVYHEVAE